MSQMDIFSILNEHFPPAPPKPTAQRVAPPSRPGHLCQHVGQKSGWTRAQDGVYAGQWVHMDPACLKPAYDPGWNMDTEIILVEEQ